eukprot:TRINITY_DN2416_c0_g2_i3.p1 TRINITY_DN2416_c0_g2~~TRINITY_DN2416_c0_g2_i3.p1  ORF type:complete len:1216 (-),score=264.47 TRINITY_DN2416_c0_g2_i3:36-3185(-)
MKVVDNLQFYINKVHIRYEDPGKQGKPLCCGITLDHIHVQSADEFWNPKFSNVGQEIKNKLVTLRHFSAYFNTEERNSKPLNWASQPEFCEKMESQIWKEGVRKETSSNQYLVEPISGTVKAQLASATNINYQPQKKFIIEIDSVKTSLDNHQYCGIIGLMDKFTLSNREIKYSKFRPYNDVRPLEDPKAWWKYAYRAVKQDVSKKLNQWSWATIKSRRKNRIQYIDLYKKYKKKEYMDTEEEEDLSFLHRILPYEDIILYRKLANASIRREKKKQQEANTGKGWFSGWWSGSGQYKNEDISSINDQVWRELYKAIDYSPDLDKSEEISHYPAFLKVEILLSVNGGSLVLREFGEERNPLVEIGLIGLDLKIESRECTQSIVFCLDSTQLLDYTTLPERGRLQVLSQLKQENLGQGKFLTISIDTNPLEAEPPIDMRVNVVMQPLRIFYSKTSVQTLVDVFKAPPSLAMADLAVAATKGVEELKVVAAQRIKYMLEQKNKLLIHFDVHAPIIYFPQDFVSLSCINLVVNLGHIIISHNSSSREIHVTSSQHRTEVSEDYFYNQYSIELKGIHVFTIHKHFSLLMDPVPLDEISSRALVAPFDIHFVVKLLTVPTNDLPQAKVSGSLPVLEFYVTKEKIVDLMTVIDAVSSTVVDEQVKVEQMNIVDSSTTKQHHFKDSSRSKVLQGTPTIVQAQVTFKISRLVLSLRSSSEKLAPDGPAGTPLVDATMNDLVTVLTVGTDIICMNMELYRFSIVSRTIHSLVTDKAQYIIYTPNDVDLEKFISINVSHVPRTSPRYNNLDTLIVGKFGEMDLNIDRITIASIIQWANSFHAAMRSLKPPAPSSTTRAQGITKVPTIPTHHGDERIMELKVELEMTCLKTLLVREGKIFLQSSLSGVAINVGVREDDTICLDLLLKGLFVTDCDNSVWPQVVSTSVDDRAVELRYQSFNPLSKSYPGFDSEIMIKMASVCFVYRHRIVEELIAYFGAFSKIREVISYTARRVANATVDIVKENSHTKVNLMLDIKTPVILIPVYSCEKKKKKKKKKSTLR